MNISACKRQYWIVCQQGSRMSIRPWMDQFTCFSWPWPTITGRRRSAENFRFPFERNHVALPLRQSDWCSAALPGHRRCRTGGVDRQHRHSFLGACSWHRWHASSGGHASVRLLFSALQHILYLPLSPSCVCECVKQNLRDSFMFRATATVQARIDNGMGLTGDAFVGRLKFIVSVPTSFEFSNAAFELRFMGSNDGSTAHSGVAVSSALITFAGAAVLVGAVKMCSTSASTTKQGRSTRPSGANEASAGISCVLAVVAMLMVLMCCTASNEIPCCTLCLQKPAAELC